jgi:hypothetical protein
MKKFLIFIGGFIAGILATIFVAYLMTIASKPNDDGLLGLKVFPEKGECITSEGELEVFQVLEPNVALANTVKYGDYGIRNYSEEIVVLIIDYNGNTFYDDQKIKIPKNKCARQIGTYQYNTKKDNFGKTVPAVVVE